MSDEILNSNEHDSPPCLNIEAAPPLEALLGYPELSEADANVFRARHKEHLAACPLCGPQFDIAARRRRKSPAPPIARGSGGTVLGSPRYTWVQWVIAASLVLTCIIFGGAYAREQTEKRKLQNRLSEHERQLEASEKESHARVPIQQAWEILRQPHQDRRQQVQKPIAEAIKRRNALPPDVDRDSMDAEIRSVFAASLAFPTIRIAPDDLSPDLVKLEDSAFLAHLTVILPDATGMAIATKSRPYFWKRGAKPEWMTKLTMEDFVVPGELSPRIDYSPDGKYLAFAPQIGGGLALWDRECTVEKHKLVGADGPGSVVLAVGFHPDSKRLFAVRADGTIPSWKIEDEKITPDQAWPFARKPVSLVAARFSPDNTWLAVADDTGAVTQIASDGTISPTVTLGRKVVALAWSPNNRTIAAALTDGGIRVFEQNATNVVYTVSAFNFALGVRLQFSPDGQFLHAAARGQGGTVYLAQTGEKLAHHSYGGSSFSKDGKWFSGSSTVQVAFVEFVPPSSIRRVAGLSADIAHIAWSKDSRRVVTLDSGFMIRVLDATKSDPFVAQFQVEPNDTLIASMADVALSEDGKQLFYARGGLGKTYAAVFDVESGKELANSRWELPGGFDRAASVASGEFLAVREEAEIVTDAGTKYRTIAHVFRMGKKEPVSERVLRKSEATDISGFTHQFLTSDGRYYAWCGPRHHGPLGTRLVLVIDMRTGETKRTGVDCSGSAPTAILSPDGKRLWFTPLNDKISTMELPNGAATDEVVLPFAIASNLTYVARPRRRSDWMFQLELTRWPIERSWMQISNPDHSVPRGEGSPFSPDGQFLAFGSSSGLFTLVNVRELERKTEEIEKNFRNGRP